ncbi:polysaccharide lyase family 14 protein [Ceratobasidium sp. AG-Ba]|nr:polysaccharide lyase family 14 protein [Ceratobasidium sp. AG-Ba]
MRWAVLLALAADALAMSAVPAGFGTLYHRRLKRTGGRRADGTCKPRTTEFPTYTTVSMILLPTLITTLVPINPTPTLTLPVPSATRTLSPTQSPNPAPAPATGLLSRVLPLGLGSATNSWTTVQNTAVKAYSLADTTNTLRPTRILGGSLQALGTAPDGKSAIEVFFARGSYAFISGVPGGISFYAYGPTDLTKATELTFGYSIYFESGFDFVHGGKLPGFYGGSTDDGAISCSGGRHALDCFSTRFMWRENGEGQVSPLVLPNLGH